MKEKMKKLESAFEELGLEKIEKLDFLLKLTKKDIRNSTDLSYQVTPILEHLLMLSRVYEYLEDEEENELLKMNQTDFFSKIHYVTALSEQILEELIKNGILHPILETEMELEDMKDSCEYYVSILHEIKKILSRWENDNYDADYEEDYYDDCDEDDYGEDDYDEDDYYDDCVMDSDPQMDFITTDISIYFDKVVGYYQILFEKQVVPKLRKDMLEENYSHALEVLINYINLKLKLLSGLDEDNSLYLSDIALRLHQLLNEEKVEEIKRRIEIDGENFDPEELDDVEYLQLLILMFENKYQRQKSCQYYYKGQSLEVEEYKKKCKKL